MRARASLWSGVAVATAAMVVSPQAAAGQRWDIDFHVGGMIATNPLQGSTALPPPGPIISPPDTIVSVPSSRRAID